MRFLMFIALLGLAFTALGLGFGEPRHMPETAIAFVAAFVFLKMAYGLAMGEGGACSSREQSRYDRRAERAARRDERWRARHGAPAAVMTDEDADAIQKLMTGLDRMEQRIGNLETILIDYRHAPRREDAGAPRS